MRKASVIIPFYGRVDQLQTCLEALERQTLPAEMIEIIVVNNGSPHDLSALQSRFPRVCWVREERTGSYASRNTGVEIASGEVIAFTDSDCVPAPEWLEEATRSIVDGTAGVVGGRIVYLEPESRRLNTYEQFEGTFFLLHRQKMLIETRHVAATANLVTTKDVFRRVGPFDTELMNFGDGDWTQRAVRCGEVLRYADRAVVYHPRRGTFHEIWLKVQRIAGYQIVHLRKQGHGGLRLFKEILRLSPLDPRSHLAVFRVSGLTPLERTKFWIFGICMSSGAMAEKLRVYFGGAPCRS